ncbi:MAG: 6-carboxytetrahydropterin synthase [Candidatus Korarchaeota archaeon]|nr:6-carboxytetrahydropterin synthase [Candidatus Korarchaeota archaeon]NIU82561.1 6-carboxytetrahydropterin synthase [Candidatus Thorarchaeota archaeon]NIW13049.1 6-carboxytetrahydropterin synthase [Candidatus Thorarchaeota archaeon]NIW51224.1 6-carboxytetrahydropterin synthase [Candidatus Korarchaeota archaeon]
MKLGMEFWIDYAHSLEGFSKCYGKHGHTAKVIIEIEGDVKGGNEFEENILLQFEKMEEKCKRVLDTLDHQDLNEIFEHPTTETIVNWIFEKLSEMLPVSRVTFFEGRGKWATVES